MTTLAIACGITAATIGGCGATTSPTIAPSVNASPTPQAPTATTTVAPVTLSAASSTTTVVPTTKAPPVAPSSSTLRSLRVEPSLDVAAHGVTLVGASPEGADGQTGIPALYATTDLIGWRDVTPPQVSGASDATDLVFESASVLDRSVWWVTTFNAAAAAVTIYRTTDAGRTWTSVAGGTHSPSAPDTTLIQLVTATTAFREILEDTGPGMALAVTHDGGRSWTTVYKGPTSQGKRLAGPFEMPMVFVHPATGFGGEDLTTATNVSLLPRSGDFFRTTNGGRQWARHTPPRPASAATCPTTDTSSTSGTLCLYGLPTFSRTSTGVVASIDQHRSRATVGFDVTTDAGANWTLRTSRAIPSGAKQRGIGATYPLVDVVSRSVWWIETTTASKRTISVTDDAGARWTVHASVPAGGAVSHLAAMSATNATLLVDATPNFRLYRTSNAGRTWTAVTLPS